MQETNYWNVLRCPFTKERYGSYHVNIFFIDTFRRYPFLKVSYLNQTNITVKGERDPIPRKPNKFLKVFESVKTSF